MTALDRIKQGEPTCAYYIGKRRISFYFCASFTDDAEEMARDWWKENKEIYEGERVELRMWNFD